MYYVHNVSLIMFHFSMRVCSVPRVHSFIAKMAHYFGSLHPYILSLDDEPPAVLKVYFLSLFSDLYMYVLNVVFLYFFLNDIFLYIYL